MTETERLPGAIVGIRLLQRHPRLDAPDASRTAQLLSFGERERQRVAEAQQVAGLVTAVRAAVDELPRIVDERLDQIAALAVELGLQVAREVVGAALDKGLCDPLPFVTRCLRDCLQASAGAPVAVRLHPDDLALVQARLEDERTFAEAGDRVRIVADQTVPRGGVRAETGAGALRYDPREALELITAEVRREVSA
jgi:flagellar biosynthesis/type III secretory pathway protein FliH